MKKDHIQTFAFDDRCAHIFAYLTHLYFTTFTNTNFWHCPHSMWSRVCAVKRYDVHQLTAANPFKLYFVSLLDSL